MKIYLKHYSASEHKYNLRLAANSPQFLEITDLSLAYHPKSSILFLFYSFWDENISKTLFINEIHKQQLRLAADTPQSLEITDLSRAYYLRSSILFLFHSFWDENISKTLFSI
jgi:hypothetical protein